MSISLVYARLTSMNRVYNNVFRSLGKQRIGGVRTRCFPSSKGEGHNERKNGVGHWEKLARSFSKYISELTFDTKPYDAGQEWSVPVTENLAKSRESEYD